MSLMHGIDSTATLIPLLVDATGRPIVTGSVDTELPAAAALSDAAANPTAPMVGAANMLWNGATWERQHGTREITLFNGTYNTTQQTPSQTNVSARGLYIWWNITAVPGVQTVTLGISAVDGAYSQGTSYLITAGFSTTGFRSYLIYPGATTTAGLTAAPVSLPIPRYWYAYIIHSGGGNFTYTVKAQYIV